MKPPIEPNKEDCCNSGCNPCIFDVYEEQLRLYNKYLKSGRTEANTELENVISPLEYSTFLVKKKTSYCDCHILLEFEKPKVMDQREVWWKPGQHFLLKYVSEDIACTRAYTPIKINKDDEYDFSIIIKVYGTGLVSKYLSKLDVGNSTLWRGPYGSYDGTSNKFSRIIMIAQGTGIAPFISIIQEILNNEDDMAKIVLFYCVANENTILLRNELYSFQQYWNFTYKIYLAKTSEVKKYKYQEPIVEHRLTFDDILELHPTHSDQFLICGSNQFNEYFQTLLKKEDNSLGSIILF